MGYATLLLPCHIVAAATLSAAAESRIRHYAIRRHDTADGERHYTLRVIKRRQIREDD